MRHIYLLFICIFLSVSALAQGDRAKAFDIAKQLDIYVQVLQKLNSSYVDDIQFGELNTIAIDAMLESLDPYTVFMPEADIDKYELLQTGQYVGIGMRSYYAKNSVVVSNILEQSPAAEVGLRVGDSIIEVDSHRIADIEEEELSLLIRGQVGTTAQLLVKRYNTPGVLRIRVPRRHIKVEQVPYSGMLNDSIAYLKLNAFSKHSAQQLRKHFKDLQRQGAKALIFDLRDNGGGLLEEAVKMLSMFVPEAQMVVEMRSKVHNRNHRFVTQQPPIAANMPLVFLVNKRSASAAEILSGAAQDLDRAVIIGEKTFGKGLVQNILPLSFGSQMKITTAKYYIPSGRCVQAIDYSRHGEANKSDDKTLFYTSSGRQVFEGEGISPDIHIQQDAHLSTLGKQLKDSALLFLYANKFVHEHDSIMAPESFEISDEEWQHFKAYLKTEDFSFKLNAEIILDSLKQDLQLLKEGNAIDFTAVEQLIKVEKQKVWDNSEQDIKNELVAEICRRYYYDTGALKAYMPHDAVVNKALEVLQTPGKYEAILTPSI